MFGWLTGLFNRSRERFVFHYRDGDGRKRSADPTAVERAMSDALGDEWRGRVTGLRNPFPPGLVGEARDQARKARADERAAVVRAIDAAFGVTPYTDHGGGRPSGMTEAERMGLLEAYNRFVIDLVALARPFPSASSRASPGPDDSPPASGAESTSAAIGSPSNAPDNPPPPSPSVSAA